ncbi:MAG: hypothetical protein H6674_11210 [Dehalococcoidia bacterium]|nr:hypothetical protein [Dehalococcoidia bacterium]
MPRLWLTTSTPATAGSPADGCDLCPLDPLNDLDGDTVCGDVDVCPAYDDRIDSDHDGIPDGCDF